MSFSANEIETLGRKAALGAGFPPDQSARFGLALARHLADGGAADVVLTALSDTSDSPILRLPLLAEDVLRAADLMPGEIELSLQPGDEHLAKAYLTSMARPAASVRIVPGPDQPRVRVILADQSDATSPLPARLSLDVAPLEKLRALAKQTEVPASDASRLAGAGAGLTDND